MMNHIQHAPVASPGLDLTASTLHRLERASQPLPGGDAVNWSEIYSGRAYPSHQSVDAAAFRGVDATGRTLFAKVYHADAARFIDLPNAAAAARHAAAIGIAPALVSDDLANGVVFFEDLGSPWRVATANDLRNMDTLAAVVRCRLAWAAASFEDRLREDELVGTRRLAVLAAAAVPAPILATLGFVALSATADTIADALAAAGTDVAPVLGDNVVSNVMLNDAGDVRLVDYDFARRGDPLRDIAGFCLEACTYDDRPIEPIVEMHLGSVRPDTLARVRLLMVVEDVAWAAWALYLHATSPRRDTCEFMSYAGSRLLRANYGLARLDVAALLRTI